MKNLKTSFKQHPYLFVPLATICSLFLIKGSVYLAIGSPIPFLISLIIFMLLGFTMQKINRTSRRIIRLLGVLVLLWGLSRLLISILFAFVPLTEAHIMEQFTIFQNLLSLAVVFSGVFILRKVKNYRSTAN